MWIELTRKWLNKPKGRMLNLNENTARILISRGTAKMVVVDKMGAPVEEDKKVVHRGRPKSVKRAPNKMVTQAANK